MLDYDELFAIIKAEVLTAVEFIMVQHGVDKNSDLIKSLDLEHKNNVFILVANDYYVWLSTGRRPRTRKVPIQSLIPWIKKNGIKGRNPKSGRFITVNQLAFAIQNGIYKNGIKGKNYIDKVDEVMVELIAEDTAELLSQLLAESIAEAIDNT